MPSHGKLFVSQDSLITSPERARAVSGELKLEDNTFFSLSSPESLHVTEPTMPSLWTRLVFATWFS